MDVKTGNKLQEIFPRYKGRPEELIPLLQEVQAELGYLPEDVLLEISHFLKVPESTLYGVSTFYAQFKLNPVGKKMVRVCRGTACHVRGAAKVLEEAEKRLGIKDGETTEDLEYSLESIACFGSCALAPVMVVDKEVHGRMTTARVKDVLGNSK